MTKCIKIYFFVYRFPVLGWYCLIRPLQSPMNKWGLFFFKDPLWRIIPVIQWLINMVPNLNGLSMAYKRGVSSHLQTETILQAIAHHHHKGMPETKKHGKKPSISQVAVGYLVRRVFTTVDPWGMWWVSKSTSLKKRSGSNTCHVLFFLGWKDFMLWGILISFWDMRETPKHRSLAYALI